MSKQIEPDYAEIGRRLAAARNSAGMTQAEVGKAIGVEGPTVARWESGENRVYAVMLRRAAKVLGVTMAYLYGEDEESGDEDDAFARASRRALPHEREAGAAYLEVLRRQRPASG